MKKSVLLSVVLAGIMGFSYGSNAHAKRRGGGGNAVACLQAALASEANPTDKSMQAVGAFINYNAQKSGICPEVHKLHRYDGVNPKNLARARHDKVKWAMAGKWAARILATNAMLACTQFRSAGHARGKNIGGNVFFGCAGNRSYAGHPHGNRGWAHRSRRHVAQTVDDIFRTRAVVADAPEATFPTNGVKAFN